MYTLYRWGQKLRCLFGTQICCENHPGNYTKQMLRLEREANCSIGFHLAVILSHCELRAAANTFLEPADTSLDLDSRRRIFYNCNLPIISRFPHSYNRYNIISDVPNTHLSHTLSEAAEQKKGGSGSFKKTRGSFIMMSQQALEY